MDLLERDKLSGTIDKDCYDKSIRVPENISNDLIEITHKSERIFYAIFNNANKQLVNSLIDLAKDYTGMYEEWELDDMRDSKEGKDNMANLFSSFKEYYYSKDGVHFQVDDSYPYLVFNYLVGESVLHIIDLFGSDEPKELGVILLSEKSINQLNNLHQEAMKFNDGKPLYKFFGSSRGSWVYSEKFVLGVS